MPAITYSPLGDESFVAVPHLSNIFGPGSNLTFTDCPSCGPGYQCKTFDVRRRVDSTVIWSIKRVGGATTRLFAVPNKRVSTIALASDGAEIVMITGPAHTGELFRGTAAVAGTVYVQTGPCMTEFYRRDGAQNFAVPGTTCWFKGMLAPKRQPSWIALLRPTTGSR